MDEFEKGVAAFLALPAGEQCRRMEEAERWAKQVSDEFDAKLRIDPMDLIQPMTL